MPTDTSIDRIRVGFDSRWYNDSGVGTYVAELLKAMAPQQQEFELVVYEDPHNPVPGLHGLALERIPLGSPRYSLPEQRALMRHCKDDRLDLLHSPFYIMPLVAPCPVVVTVHDLIPFLFRTSAWPKRSMVRAGYRLAVRRSAHLIADSSHTAQDLRRLLGVAADKITAVPLGACHVNFHSREEDGEVDCLRRKYGVSTPYVMVASARNWRTKNLGTALHALTLARRKAGLDFQTVVYGPGTGLEVLAPAKAWRGLDLRRLGYVPAPDLGALLRHSLLFLMPSLYEGFGLPALEAMSCGCPVVTSDAGSLPEVVGNGGQTFPPSDTEGMADAVARLLRCPDEVKKWRGAAARRANDFSWEKTAADTLRVYRRVLLSGKAGRGEGWVRPGKTVRGGALEPGPAPRGSRWTSLVKRTFDVTGSALLLALTAPLIAFLALLIKLQDGGPVLYRRRVIGLAGEFDAFKLRSMGVDADQILGRDPALRREFEVNFKLRHDPRVTPLGSVLRKWSLDELPQLFNVLRGEMSLVGPRMITPAELQRHREANWIFRSVKPGLTGYWQVYGRQSVSYEQRIAMDVFYVNHRSLLLDLKILLRTPLRVARGAGAY